MGRRRLYKSAEEAKAAQKAQQAAFRAARKNGTWVRKNKKRVPGALCLVPGASCPASDASRPAAGRATSMMSPPRTPLTTAPQSAASAASRPSRKSHSSHKSHKSHHAREATSVLQDPNATRHEELLAEYGFEVWRNKPVDPHSAEELAARKRYAQAEEAAYRARHRAHITEYNREYRRRKRAAELVAAQKTWTAAEWAAYQRRTALKESGPGTPAWLVREVVKRLAAQENLPEEIVTQQLIERGGLDFIVQGALALGPEKTRRPAFIAAAFRATCLYLNPDRAVLCGVGAGGSGIRNQGSGRRGRPSSGS